MQNATHPVSDPVIAQAQRWATIRNLHAQIDKAEAAALGQDDYADQFENFGKGKKDALAKVMDAVGSVPPSSTVSKLKSIAPKQRACGIS